MTKHSSPTSSARSNANANSVQKDAERSGRSAYPDPAPDLWLYRQHTTALLRRYFRLSVELGRLPSLLGREFFRSHVTSYRMSSFEDGMIFVHDVERCLEKMKPDGKTVIARLVFQEYTAEEAATLLGCTRRTIVRRYLESLDQLSEIFLTTGLLRPFPVPAKSREKHREEISACGAEVTRAASREDTREIPVKPCSRVISPQPALVEGNIVCHPMSQLHAAV